MQRKKNIRITTPTGVAQWPRLNEPDTKFDKDGVYSVSLRLPKDDATELVSTISNVLYEFVDELSKGKKKSPKLAPLPIKDVTDAEDNPTGEVEIRFKMRAVGGSGSDRWEQRPALFDSAGKPMSETIGGGSRIKIGAEVVPYNTAMAGAGVTLRLKAVQVIELVEYTKGDSFNAWEFSEENGFVSNSEPVSKAEGSSEGDDFDF